MTTIRVREEFIALGRKPGRSPAEETRLTALKREMADHLMSRPASEIYEVVA